MSMLVQLNSQMTLNQVCSLLNTFLSLFVAKEFDPKKEWYSLLVKEMFAPKTGLFKLSTTNTAYPNPDFKASDFTLEHFKFAGSITAMVN